MLLKGLTIYDYTTRDCKPLLNDESFDKYIECTGLVQKLRSEFKEMLSFQRDIYFLFTNALDSHSMLSSRPSPLTALALNIWNVRFLSASRPRAWWTSVTDMAPSISCLLASTTSIADFSSSSSSIETSSCFEMPILSLSAESTT